MINESKFRERQDKVKIICPELGESFSVEKRVAIPLVEALRVYQRMNESPESMSTDISATAQILLTLSGISY